MPRLLCAALFASLLSPAPRATPPGRCNTPDCRPSAVACSTPDCRPGPGRCNSPDCRPSAG